MKVRNVLVGADIELFLMDKTNSKIVSAEGFIQGTKQKPFNFDPSNRYFSTSLDNVLAEFNIPPVNDKASFLAYIKRSVDYINQTIPASLCTVAIPSAILDDEWLQTDNAKLFGCESDDCVWTRSTNDKPSASNANLRSAGGHIHIGYDEPDMFTSELIVKAMDLYIGIPSVIQEPDNDRKKLYGKAGCCRFKDYGVEYRTVSNYYAQDNRLTEWMYEAIERAIAAVNNDMDFDQYHERIIQAINGNDVNVAKTLIKELDIPLS